MINHLSVLVCEGDYITDDKPFQITIYANSH
jgi:hypothetical protein